MLGPTGFLDSREKATVVWTVVLLIYVCRKDRSIVRSLFGVLRSMFAPKLSLVWSVAAAYTAMLVLAADEAGLWDRTAIKATIYWFVGTAAILSGKALTTWRFDREYAMTLLRNALRLTIIVEFLLTLYDMPLAADLVFVPLLGLFVMMQVVANHDPKLANVKALLDRALMLVGLGLVTWVIIRASTDLHGLLTRDNAERLLLPSAFTLAFVPVLYGMWRWSQWDRNRVIRRWHEENPAA